MIGAVARRCRGCGIWFATHRLNQRYCTARCRIATANRISYAKRKLGEKQ